MLDLKPLRAPSGTMKAKPPVQMLRALELAAEAAVAGEVPVGCVIATRDGRVVAEARNRTREWKDPTAHAELIAIRAACRALGSERIAGHDLFVTLEPCAMCATAISYARIDRVYYGAGDEKMGGVDHGPRIFTQATCLHRPEVYDGIAANEAVELLRKFFKDRR